MSNSLIGLQIIAVVTTAVAWIPQWWLASRAHNSADVSTSAWAQAGAIGMTWGLWGAAAHVWALAFSNGLFALGTFAILATLLKRNEALLVIAAAISIGISAVTFVLAALLGATACFFSVTARLAQVAKLRRTRTATSVSASTWFLLAISSAIWALVGAITGQRPLLVGGVVSVVFSVAVTLVTRWTRVQTAYEGG